MTAQLLVETADLRRALRSAGLFVAKGSDVDVTSALARVHVLATPSVTYVSATTGSAAGLALVSTLTLAVDGEPSTAQLAFDLSPTDVAMILTCFPGRDGKDGEPGDELQFDVHDEHLVVTDASGLFAGQSLTVGRLPNVEHPVDLLATFRWLLESEPSRRAGVVQVPPASLALVVSASKVQGAPVFLEPHERSGHTTCLVRLGESFLAALTEAFVDEEQLARAESFRGSWKTRLGRDAAPLKAVKRP